MQQIGEGFTDIVAIGENRHGYTFCAGKLACAWYGIAIGKINEKEHMAFILPGCSEDEIDHLLPEISEDSDVRSLIIRRVGAVAFFGEHGYGGIENWLVPENLRGTIEEFLCAECESVSCTPESHNDYYGEEL